jgi:CubicO group peptidase (beta-lactamase class C family)
MKSSGVWAFGSPESFGSPGAGGSLGFADPKAQIGYGYIPNRKSVEFAGDPRDVALRKALYSTAPVVESLAND